MPSAASGGGVRSRAGEARRRRDARGAAGRAPGKVWEGRFGAATARRVEEYTTSLAVDARLFAEDIEGSLAHVRMLRLAGLVTGAEHRALQRGLRAVGAEFERGEFAAHPGDEDVHTAVERRLHEIAGPVAGRLHTGRSRNDQVATDLRLWCRRRAALLMLGCAALQEALIERAAEHRHTVLPGYTHLQRAQVVSLAHHLLAYVEMLQRDITRFEAAWWSSDVLPLGSGALAGTTLPIDREIPRRELGFSAISGNSLDAVSDRDFAVELVSACALCMVHLSRLAGEVVLWTTAEFGFAELPDAQATGSSLMPQKKNPDVCELARARSARVGGGLVTLLTMLHGLPLAYDRDLQEDKEPLFAAVDTTAATLAMLADVVTEIRFDTAAMRRAASDPLLLATDVAELLVVRGMPFREAHLLVGRIVRECLEARRSLADLSLAEWRRHSELFDEGVLRLFDPEAALRRRDLPGGPGPRGVGRQLSRARARVARTRATAGTLGGHDPAHPRRRRHPGGPRAAR